MTLRSLTMLAAILTAAGCDKKKPTPATTAPPPATTPAETPATTPAAALAPAPEKIDYRNTNQGGGPITGSYRAGKRANLLNTMSQLGQLVEVQYNETGKMPDPAAIKANLTTARNILKDIDEGWIVLTGTKDHNGLWAHEVDADKAGGVALVAGRAQRASADEIKQWLGKR